MNNLNCYHYSNYNESAIKGGQISFKDLQERAEAELNRRDPRRNWKCSRCEKTHYHEKEIRVSGGFVESFLGWENNKYHAVVCNYCGKTEFYNVHMSGAEKSLGIMGN